MAVDVVLMVPVIVRVQTDARPAAIESAKRKMTEWLGAAGCIPPEYKMAALETRVVSK